MGLQMKYLFLLITLTGFLASGQAVPQENTTGQRMKTMEALHQGFEYLSALATADRLLGAWLTDQPDVAESLLTKGSTSEDELESFLASPAPRAFEIKHGKRVHAGAIRVPCGAARPSCWEQPCCGAAFDRRCFADHQ
jgi:hypothetical protein